MKYIILGRNGFLGKHLTVAFKNRDSNVTALDRNQFDITEPKTYNINQFRDSTIIDCIANIDNPDTTLDVNYTSLKLFIDSLNKNNINYKYIYFSTTSVDLPALRNGNPYIKSKFHAEDYIKKNIKSYLILRLSFPIGRGQDKNRLIPNLVSKIQNKEKLTIDRLKLNITPISFITKNIFEVIKKNNKTLNFTHKKQLSLEGIVKFIYKQLNVKENYTISNTSLDISVRENFAINDEIDIDKSLQLTIDEYR